MRFDFYTPSEITRILAQRLKEQRLCQNLSQAQLAQQAGVGLSTVIRIESGQGGTFKHVVCIAVALGLINEFSSLFDFKPKTFEDVVAKKTPRKRASRRIKK